MNSRLPWAACLVAVLGLAASAEAGAIRSPTAVLANTGGDFSGAYDIGNVIDHSGLSAGFTSGVTDFDTYLAGAPTHTIIAPDFEHFTPSGVNASTIDFDLGGIFSILRMAYWNEEFSGVDSMSVFTSNDPLFGVSTAVGAFAPTNSPTGLDYTAEVFDLVDTDARYVRLMVTGPQVPNDGHDGIGMAELAFDTTDVGISTVPLPAAAWAGLALLGALAGARRARRRS